MMRSEGSPDWARVKGDVAAREECVAEIAENLKTKKINAAFEIAATDVFVEKAQDELHHRSNTMHVYAGLSLVTSLLSFFCVAGLSVYFSDNLKIDDKNWISLVADIIRNATYLGFGLGFIYIQVALFKAFMHEATSLSNRVHSTRLGRLYIYLKFISCSDSDDIIHVRDDLTAEDFERVFGWNIETSSAFKDVDPKAAVRTIWSNIPETVKNVSSKNIS